MASQAKAIKPIHERLFCYGERVMVERIEDSGEEVTKGGVLKPEIARQKPNRGRVVALGEGRFIEGRWMPLNLSVGDVVDFSRTAIGVEKEIDGKPYLLLHWKQIETVDRA